jgi:AcrR family transcriptional regulator
MSSSHGPYGDPETRKRILDVALDLAAELGPSMRLADVSKGAGVSHQGLYLHFRGRDGLLLALLPHMVEAFDIRSHHQRVVDADDGRAAIEMMVRFLGELNRRLDTIGWVLEEAQHLNEAFGRDWRRRVEGLRAAIETDVVRRLTDEGLLRPGWTVADAADLFLAVTTLGAWRELTRELGWTPDQYIENITRLIGISLLVEGWP